VTRQHFRARREIFSGDAIDLRGTNAGKCREDNQEKDDANRLHESETTTGLILREGEMC
jgi:hypothetical protein